MIPTEAISPGDVTRFSGEDDRLFVYVSAGDAGALALSFCELASGELAAQCHTFGGFLFEGESFACRP